MPNGKMNCFADRNFIVCTIDPSEPEKRRRSKDFLNQIMTRHTLVLSSQSLNECYRVVTEKRGLMPRSEAQLFVFALSEFCSAPYDFDVTQKAWQIQDQNGFAWWDCTLLASAMLAGCDLFLSEDMQHERVIERLIIVNPFKLARDFQFTR